MLEALHCDVPVICSNTSSLPEVAGKAALLVDPRSESDLVAAMEKIYRNEGLRKDLVEEGRRHRRQFDWDKAADQLYTLLKTAARPA